MGGYVPLMLLTTKERLGATKCARERRSPCRRHWKGLGVSHNMSWAYIGSFGKRCVLFSSLFMSAESTHEHEHMSTQS